MIHFRFGKNLIFGTGNSQGGGYFEDIYGRNQLDIYQNVAVTRTQHPDSLIVLEGILIFSIRLSPPSVLDLCVKPIIGRIGIAVWWRPIVYPVVIVGISPQTVMSHCRRIHHINARGSTIDESVRSKYILSSWW